MENELHTDLKHLGKRPGHRRAGARRVAVLPALGCFLAGLALGWVLPRPGPPAATPHTAREAPRPGPAATDAGSVEFEFYTLLPGAEVKMPEWQAHRAEQEPAPGAAEQAGHNLQGGPRYILQAGSFRLLEQAERRYRNLAEFGIEGNIQSVDLDTGGRWYRVLIGPGTDLAELQALQERLRRRGLRSLLLRLVPGAPPDGPEAPGTPAPNR